MSYQVYYKYMSSISCAYMYLCTRLCMLRHVFGDVCMETKGQPQPFGAIFKMQSLFSFSFFKNGSVTNLEISQRANLADQ